MKRLIVLDQGINTSQAFDRFLIGVNTNYLNDYVFEIESQLSVDALFEIILPILDKGNNVLIIEIDPLGKIASYEKRTS